MTEALEEAQALMRSLERRRAKRHWEARHNPNGTYKPRHDQNRFIHDQAHIREPIGNRGAELWIGYTGLREEALRLRELPDFSEFGKRILDPDALNGYISFPRRHAPRLPKNIGNIVQYIPVHGGVTYARRDGFAVVWGFDTNHAGSEDLPRTDPDWMRYQCHILYSGLEAAEQLWPQFERERNRQKRAEMAQKLMDIDLAAAEEPILKRLGFEALINAFLGQIG